MPCSHAKVNCSIFINVTTRLSLRRVPTDQKSQPFFLCIDSTMVSKFGKKFAYVPNCLIVRRIIVPITSTDTTLPALHCICRYVIGTESLPCRPAGYRMWQKNESKLALSSTMVRQVMPEFHAQKNVIILCDSRYVKQNLVSVIEEYENLDLIGNARANSVIYDLAPLPTGKMAVLQNMAAVCQ